MMFVLNKQLLNLMYSDKNRFGILSQERTMVKYHEKRFNFIGQGKNDNKKANPCLSIIGLRL